ncbi:cytochrome ubiquinol oxidase subunit I [Nitrospira moscoviensis]|uniref:Cytochrome bd oxidase subunit I n=1 Tax=Nitrospira moscoviensis TaxID=42253 RepID=A0A0K2GDH0_NITMO|nr:cytochrome ubiquinol oxidase subunit I [Nitrospira moscoviensis]ALA59000.1 Cytochrome bd oxidase subunit I [Nitrospira moscoviensis]
MSDLLAARSQMAMSLAFHIVFAALGIAMPALMAVAEWRWMRTGDARFLTLAQRWSKGTAILFAVGAVSGTVLSFELGLLWPSFMERAGPLVGPLFALEGFAFFTEAIFLGIYLYGWSRISPRAHFSAGLIVAASGILSAVFVVAANAWMNAPTGFELEHGRFTRVDPWAPFRHPVAWNQIVHMLLAAFAATGFLVAGIHAFLLLRRPDRFFHREALQTALLIGGLPALLQPISGDLIAKSVAVHQPAKLAAMEALFHTEAGAPFVLGGLPDEDRRTVRYGLFIPGGLSVLLHYDPQAVVPGLDAVPREDWPPVAVVHLAFQLMVACGLVLAALAAWSGWHWIRGRSLASDRWLLRGLVAAAPLGFVAIEAGWVVTEVGRQPWIIDHVVRTADAVTPMPGLWLPMTTFTLLYLVLSAVVVWAIHRHVAATDRRTLEPMHEAAA